jgi:hypothetical protein
MPAAARSRGRRRLVRDRLAGFEYLLGAAAGGLALALGGFSALGLTLAGLFAAAALIHVPSPVITQTPVTLQATA